MSTHGANPEPRSCDGCYQLLDRSSDGCTIETIEFNGYTVYERERVTESCCEYTRCPECLATMGMIHHVGCVNEHCPRCGDFLRSPCRCWPTELIPSAYTAGYAAGVAAVLAGREPQSRILEEMVSWPLPLSCTGDTWREGYFDGVLATWLDRVDKPALCRSQGLNIYTIYAGRRRTIALARDDGQDDERHRYTATLRQPRLFASGPRPLALLEAIATHLRTIRVLEG